MNLTRTPLLSTRRKVDSQGWQSREGREEGGNRTCHVLIIISQILWTIFGCRYSDKISFQSYDSLLFPKFTKFVLAEVQYQTHRLAGEPFLPWVRVPQLDDKGEQAGVHLGQVEPGKTK